MVGIRTDLTGTASDTFEAAVKQRQLDLPGGKIRSMEDLGGTEQRTEAEHKYLPKEADEDAKVVPPVPNTPIQVVDAPDSTEKQGPEQASSAAAQLKQRTAAAKFYSKEAEEDVKKISAKAYPSMQALDAQYVTEEQGLKLVIPVLEKRTTIKERTAVAQKFYSKEEEQEVKISICDNGMIDIDLEILGAGPDSEYITLPGHLEEYIYENFQRTPFKFIFSWRKRPFEEMHILPLPRMQFSGSTTCALSCET